MRDVYNLFIILRRFIWYYDFFNVFYLYNFVICYIINVLYLNIYFLLDVYIFIYIYSICLVIIKEIEILFFCFCFEG